MKDRLLRAYVVVQSLNGARTCALFRHDKKEMNVLKERATCLARWRASQLELFSKLDSLQSTVTQTYIFDAKDLFRALNGGPTCQITFEKHFPFGMFTGNLYKFEPTQG